MKGRFLGLVLALASTSAIAADARFELRLATGVLWLGETPFLHSFTESAQLGSVRHRSLFGLSADVATGNGRFGVAWLGLTYGVASPWDVTVVKKHDDQAEPRHLDAATVHLLMVKAPAPRLRLTADDFTFLAQATLGVRTGLFVQGAEAFSPIELMLSAVAGADYLVARGWAVGLTLELLHSLATGWPTGMLGLQLRRWL